jgi:rhodanese-related sulfurtransferase
MSTIESLRPVDAWQRLEENTNAVLIDVRDPVEFAFVGHPLGAINIPWKTAPDWQLNPHFIHRVRVETADDKDCLLLVLCRSGQRSLDAARALEEAGFRRLANIEEGFEGPLDENKHRGQMGGWRHAGLPWQQS